MSRYINEVELEPINESYCLQLPPNNVIGEVFIEANDVYRKNGGLHGLQKWWVVYAITDGRGWYIGYTNDFGQRINDHLRDSRAEFSLLQCALRETGKMYVRALGVYGSNVMAFDAEQNFIRGYKVHVIKDIIGLKNWRIVSNPFKELRKHCYNVLPLIDYERIVK